MSSYEPEYLYSDKISRDAATMPSISHVSLRRNNAIKFKHHLLHKNLMEGSTQGKLEIVSIETISENPV